MVNGRVTAEQMDWLQARADELGGNLSAALRQTIADARILEMARLDYERLLKEHPEFTVPYNDDDGTSRVFDVALRIRGWKDEGDDELRKLEERGTK